jgi:enamine deaminase RidA (YjgF/YER057c/UK114 family)
MQTVLQNGTEILHSKFSTSTGYTESYISLNSRDDSTFEEALKELTDAYQSALADLELNQNTLHFTRVYVTDATNEFQLLQKSPLYQILQSGAVSVIQQSPLSGPLSLLSYHIQDETNTLIKNKVVKEAGDAFQSVFSEGKFYNFLWTAQGNGGGTGSREQTDNLFSQLSATLGKHQMNLRNNTVRTWIYVRDIDNNYAGMVTARKELFSKIGLTDKTRYIASTGIEGQVAKTSTLVSADSLSIGNLQEEQIIRMEAPENLSSTIIYGVTFERGLRIQFGDRSHLHISGTASIDKNGEILYPGDIRGQTERTIENIEALLRPHNATLENMQYLLLYVRNRKHYQFIQDILAEKLPVSIPLIPVEGSVCRPGWLIEMEGLAIIEDSTHFPPFL